MDEASSLLQYDEQFVALMRALDPAVVTDGLLIAANSAILQQERTRARWARRGIASAPEEQEHQADDQEPESSPRKQVDDDGESVSSSSSSPSASDADDDDDDVATAFCRSFLAPDGAVEHFVRDMRATAQTLQSLRGTIKRFARRIDGVASEVGVLQAKAKETERSLVNTHNVRQLTSAAIETLVPSQDMARVLASAVVSADEDAASRGGGGVGALVGGIVSGAGGGGGRRSAAATTDLPEMGRQIVHSVRQLERLLAARQVRVLNVAAATQHSAAESSGAGGEGGASACLVLDLRQAPALEAISSHVVDALARQTALLVRNFLLPRVAAVLGKPRTNITIQQRSALLPYRALVKFLKSCATNPEFIAMRSNGALGASARSASGDDDGASAMPVISAAEAASAFYNELRAYYVHCAGCVYATNFQSYMAECLALQLPKLFFNQAHKSALTARPIAPAPAAPAAAPAAADGGWFGWLSGGANTATATAAAATPSADLGPSFPQIADVAANISPADFSARVAATLFSPVVAAGEPQLQLQQQAQPQNALLTALPVLPVVQKAKRQHVERTVSGFASLGAAQQQQRLAAAGVLHSPIETLRSVHLLLSDVVTSEFLFSFEFFDGDTSVYDRVFRPVVDALVHFVMAHFLPATTGRGGSGGGSVADAHDAVGLGLLSLIAATFRGEMHRRSLHCLDEYFSHVLALLLPCTTRAVRMQHASLKTLLPPGESAKGSAPALTSPPRTKQQQAAQQAAHMQSLDLFMRVHSIAGNASALLAASSNASSSARAAASMLLKRAHPVVERVAHFAFSMRCVLVRWSAADSSNHGSTNNNGAMSARSSAAASHGDAEMLQDLCAALTGLMADFDLWLQSFARFVVRACFPPASVAVLPPQQRYQAVPEQLDSVLLVNNTAALLRTWAQLGFAARVESAVKTADDDGVAGESAAASAHERPPLAPLRAAASLHSDPALAAADRGAATDGASSAAIACVIAIDKRVHDSYEAAVDALAYDVLQHTVGDVIVAVRDAETAATLGEQPSTAEPGALPPRLEAAARRFVDAARELPSKIADFLRAALPQHAAGAADTAVETQQQQRSQFAHPQLEPLRSVDEVHPHLDVLKKCFTQLLMWNTRLHAALSVFFASAPRQVQQQRLRGMTVSNVQLSEWMAQQV